MNCLTYAFGKWFREGGYVLMRASRLAGEFGVTSKWHPASWVPHFLHRDMNHVVTQFTATDIQRALNHKRGLFLTWISLWSFDGEVIGDDKKVGK